MALISSPNGWISTDIGPIGCNNKAKPIAATARLRSWSTCARPDRLQRDTGYDRRCRYLTADERAAREADGRSWVIRLAVPETGQVTFHDAIRGDITFDNARLQDIVLLKSDGWPTYHLASSWTTTSWASPTCCAATTM